MAIAAYLTAAHYQQVPLACSTTQVVDCTAVTQSSASEIPGTSLPITFLGLGWFLISGLLAGAALRQRRRSVPEQRWLSPLHFAWAASGLVYVLYLVYVELLVLHRICEWCTAVHLLVFGSFLVTLRGLQTARETRSVD